jgi:hypothetical protein
MYADVLDLSTPFAVVALPTSEPVDDAAIEAAHAALLALYPDDGPLRTRIVNALPRAEQRHTWIFTDGVVQMGDQRVKLSKDGQEYVCSCPDWKWKRLLHQGMCSHVCACEHVRMAQATRMGAVPPPTRMAQATRMGAVPPPTASLTVQRSVLAYALSACCATGAQEIRVQYDDTFGWLQLQAASIDISVEIPGAGSTDLLLPVDVVVAAIAAISPTSGDLLVQVIDNQLVFADAPLLA